MVAQRWRGWRQTLEIMLERDPDPMTAEDVAEASTVGVGAVRGHIRELVEAKRVKRAGVRRLPGEAGRPKTLWRVTYQGRAAARRIATKEAA